MGGVSVSPLAAIQCSERLDREPSFRSRRTRLHWSAEAPEGAEEIVFALDADGLRTVRLRTAESDPRALADFISLIEALQPFIRPPRSESA